MSRRVYQRTGMAGTVPEPLSASTPLLKNVQLPVVAVDSMTKSELKEFIPKLLRKVSGKEDCWNNKRSTRPVWWPHNVPWATSLTDLFSEKYWRGNINRIVLGIYKHFGREDLLTHSRNSPSIQSVAMKNQVEEKRKSPASADIFPKDNCLSFCEIFMCYFCEEEFSHKEELKKHHSVCNDRPPDLQKHPSSPLPSPRQQHCPPQISPNPLSVGEYKRVPREEFVQYIDLLPKQKAARLRRQYRPSLEINCDVLDMTDPQSPLSPVTPRTPKSLISQLSREDSSISTRKRLSYSQSIDRTEEMTVESESSDSGDEQEDVRIKTSLNLLSIDVSSLLGQRIQKHVRVDMTTQVVEDTENYCRTPVKNSFLEKLRSRPPTYPVTYRPRRHDRLGVSHVYRFTSSQKKDFSLRMETGLNRKSRELRKKMKKLSVVVHCMTRNELKRWMSVRDIDKQLKLAHGAGNKARRSVDSVFPDGPLLLSKNIDKLLGLKKRSKWRSDHMRSPLSLSNFVSEEMEAEIAKQKLTLYRSLLNEFSLYRKETASSSDSVISGKILTSKDASGKSRISEKLKALQQQKEIKSAKLLRKNEKQSKTNSDDGETVSRWMYSQTSSLDVDVSDSVSNKSCLSSPMSCCGGSSSVECDENSERRKQAGMNDSISILSVSSDGESVHSNCCAGCKNLKSHSSMQHPATATKAKSSKTVDLEKLDSTSSNIQTRNSVYMEPVLLEPLTVNVGDAVSSYDIMGSPSAISMTYGIPSPVSVAEESPRFASPVDPDPQNGKEGDGFDLVADSGDDQEKEKTEVFATNQQGKTKKLTTNKTVHDIPVSCGTRQSKAFCDRIQLLKAELDGTVTGRCTRSKSLTPSSSPVKSNDGTRSNLSVPSSPAKSDLRRALMSKATSSPAKLLRRSVASKSLGTGENNQYSLRSGNFVLLGKSSHGSVSSGYQSPQRASSDGPSSPVRPKRKTSPLKVDLRPVKMRKL